MCSIHADTHITILAQHITLKLGLDSKYEVIISFAAGRWTFKEFCDGLLKDVNIKLMIQNIQRFGYNTVMLTVKIHSLVPIPQL